MKAEIRILASLVFHKCEQVRGQENWFAVVSEMFLLVAHKFLLLYLLVSAASVSLP